MDDEMRDCLDTLCVSELRRRLPLKFEIHDRTMVRTLDGMLFGVKLARPLPSDRRSHGKARQGERAYRQVCGRRVI